MKRVVYVVDDQAPVLEMAVLILRNFGWDWEVTGFQDPFAALAAIQKRAPDAILSDQIMPGMQGSELLELVRQQSPGTLRFIMSGYVALHKLTLITSAHQYIAKPFEPMKLRDLIQRSFLAQERIIDRGLKSVVTSIRSIPSLPQAHHSLLEELEDDRSPGSSIARLVGSDPGLSVKVLQLANSSLFGQGRLINSPAEAVSCLGTELIAAVVLSQSIFRHYESLKHREIDLPRVWSHCQETACLAQYLCRKKRLPRQTGEEAFLAGLLHEVGRFVLIDNFPEQFQAACDLARQNKISLSAALGQTLHATPAQLSCYLLELWGLPAPVVQSVCLVNSPEEDPAPGFSLTSALYLADRLASKNFPADSFPLEDLKPGYLEATGCADDFPEWEQLGSIPE